MFVENFCHAEFFFTSLIPYAPLILYDARFFYRISLRKIEFTDAKFRNINRISKDDLYIILLSKL